MIKRYLTVMAVIVTGIFLASALAAGEDHDPVLMQITTAQTHSKLAVQAQDVSLVHAHLHHALNCLVAYDDQGYDHDIANPCEHIGNGAIPDLGNQSPMILEKLKMAVAAASEGVKSDNYESAHKAARKMDTLLKQAEKIR